MTLSVKGGLHRGEFTGHFDLQVAAGGITAILGPNGCGKTSLLRTIAGLERLDTGAVEVDGSTWQSDRVVLAPEARSVGLVLAAPTLFPRMSVLDNVAYGPRSRGQADAVAVAREELRQVGLLDRAEERPTSLSSGQAARVALARALATRPDVLLLDEPFAAMDARTHEFFRRSLTRRLEHYDGSAVLVTHDPLDALTLADQVQVMVDGELAAPQSPTEIVSRPATPYAAQVAGLNLIPVRSERGIVEVEGPRGRSVTIAHTAAVGDGANWVAIRPSAISLWPDRPDGSPQNVWRLTITSIELATRDAVRIGLTGDVDLVAAVHTFTLASKSWAVGDRLWATVKTTDVEVYPR